jgi:hypothetical protein
VSSQNGPGWHTLDEGFSTRNRKVEGSNPSSGSKTAGQRAFRALLAGQRRPAAIPLGPGIVPQVASPCFATSESVWLIEGLRCGRPHRPTPGETVRADVGAGSGGRAHSRVP